MKEIDLNELKLWNEAYFIRCFVEDQSFYYGANPLSNNSGLTLISAVEQIFLTDGMMAAFLRDPEPDGMFAADMRKWGLIQAFVVQQDAVHFLASILSAEPLSPSKHPVLKIIRDDLRNRYVGHPVGDRKPPKFAVTSSSSKVEACFIELTEGNMELRRFNLNDAIEQQRSILFDFLCNLKSKVMKTEEGFRQELRTARPLDAIRHSTFQYNLSKVCPESAGIHFHHAQEIQQSIRSFCDAFKNAGQFNRYVESDLARMGYAADQIAKFYEPGNSEQRLTSDDIPIFVGFLGCQYKKLTDDVAEIEARIDERVS